MKTKRILVAAVAAATLTSGCMAFQELTGHTRESSSNDASFGSIDRDDAVLVESRRPVSGEATDDSAATTRAAAAADRAASVAARASRSAEKTETGFHKSLNK